MLDPYFSPRLISAAILREPLVKRGAVCKGAIVLNHVDNVVQLLPEVRRFFLIIESGGWSGIAHSDLADIKLIEDASMLELSRRVFQRAVLLPLGNADFVDTSAFRPLGLAHEYDVIQIARWSKRKRIPLLIAAAAKLPQLSFLQLGSFENRGTQAELEHRDACLRFAEKSRANVAFPFAKCDRNDDLPWQKGAINRWINKARVGVSTSYVDGHKRFKMECMAADRPMLVARDSGMTAQKHITQQTGDLFEPNPDALARAIVDALDHRERFAPRRYVLDHSGRALSIAMLRAALKEACSRTGEPYRFEDVEWDGRSERFVSGEAALSSLTAALGKYRSLLADQSRARLGSRSPARTLEA
jgi:glycosyltransferase involved in cell wall biosynthesis